MYRYVALVWDTANSAGAASAGEVCELLSGWTRAVSEPGLIVLDSGASGSSGTRVLDGGRGALCGRVFPDVSDPTAILSTQGQALIDRHWGRYVAFLKGTQTQDVHVLRDPTAGMPCFVTSWRDIHIAFSDIESIRSLKDLDFSINWKYVASFVAYSALQIRATGLNEVTEVQAGERLTFRAGRIERRLVWHPLNVVQRGLIEDAPEAIRRIRECVRYCVHTWAGLYGSVLHDLSGGLDSSMVLSCLKDAPGSPRITCVHFYAPASREDEREYARLAAGHFNADLVECALEPDALDLRRLFGIRHSPRPWFYMYDLEQAPLESQVVSSRGASAIFSGAGGDGLFLQGRAELAVADFLRRHGASPRVMRVALNAARITRTSLWPTLRDGVRLHLKRPAHDFGGTEGVRTLISPEVLETARNDDSLLHPWLAGVGSLPPGLLWHIMCVSLAPAYYGAFENPLEVERTPALLSQPLIELCLRIPSYVWISGGRDRSLVRTAFAADLPPAIVRRVRKGAIDRHNRKLMDANEEFLREVLLEGLLVRHGLLDRAQLERVLSRNTSPEGFEYNEVTRHHLGTEIWLRRWSESARVSH